MTIVAQSRMSLISHQLREPGRALCRRRRGGLAAKMALAALFSSAVVWSQPLPTGGTPIITTVAGSGTRGYFGDGYAATVAGLNFPNGVAVDSSGNLYIADTSNYVIRKVTPSGTITTVAGNGTTGSTGDGGPATSAKLTLPKAVAADNSGNLFIADGNVIRKVTPDGVIHKVTGGAPPGSACTGNNCTAPKLAGGVGLAVDTSGNLYVADMVDNVILKVTPGSVLSVVAGNGTIGYSGDGGWATNATLSYPAGVAVDPAGNLYISDSYNRVVRKVSTAGVITTVAGNGFAGNSGDGGPATNAQLSLPYGLGVDSAGSLYIADVGSSVVRKVTNGIISTVAGDGTFGYSGDGGAATSAQLNYPYGITLDALDNLYIADDLNQRIRKVGLPSVTAPPVFNPAPGTYPIAQNVTILSTLAGATIYYTTDGTAPSTLSSVYSGPITVSSTETIEAIAVAAGSPTSVVAIGRYIIGQQIITTVAGNGTVGSGGDGGPAINTPLNFPFGVAVDPLGNLYIADSYNSAVRKVTPGGIITIVAGNYSPGSSGDGGPAISAQLHDPYGVAVDTAGNVYIADSSNNVVREVKLDGTISVVAGNYSAGYSGDSGAATSAKLNSPYGVAVDGSGNVYIADTFNARVRRVDPGGTITTVAGNGTSGYSGDGGAAIIAQLNLPNSVAVDISGNLYISDSLNSAIRRVTPSGAITTVAGNGTAGYSGDGGLATAAQLKYPKGVAVDASGDMLIVDGNDVIREVSSGGIITTVAGTGVAGYSGDGGPATSAQLFHSNGIAVGVSGTFYIADTSNHRIRRVRSTTLALADPPQFSPAGGTYASAQSVSITDTTPAAAIYYTTDGSTPTTASNFYSNPITVSSTGTIQAIAVASGFAQSTVAQATYAIASQVMPVIAWADPAPIVYGTTLSAAQLNASASVPGTFVYTPAAGTVLAIGSQTLDVTFTPNDTVTYAIATKTVNIQITPVPSPIITTVAGDGTSGYFGNNGPANIARLSQPLGVAVDSSGNTYIADSFNNVIRQVAPDGIITTVAGSVTQGYYGDGGPATSAALNLDATFFSGGGGVAVDASNNLYIADTGNHVIRKVTTGGVISTVAGNNTAGYSGDGGLATSAQLNRPVGVTVDSSGNLYIADASNYVVRRVTPGGIITVAGNNTPGYSGDSGQATSAQLHSPWGVAVDTSYNLYISDVFDQVIRKVTLGGIITTMAGNGTAGFSGDGGLATSAQFNTPRGLSVDTSGNLYVADQGNGAIRQVTPGGIITTVAGNGTRGYSGDGGPAKNAELNQPFGVAVDPAGNLWIADSLNNRIRKVGSGALTAAPEFSPTSGTYTSAQTVTISDATAGATIYYTTDGTTPTTSSSVYSAAITVSASETIQAFAIANGFAQSAIATATYTIAIVPTPTIDWSNPVPITEGTALSAVQLNASSPVAGSFGYTPAAGTVPGVGYRALRVVFTPTDAVNYTTATAMVTILVTPIPQSGPTITTVVGDGNLGYSGDGGPAVSAQLHNPTAVATDASGNLYFADYLNHVIRKVDSHGTITTVAGNGTAGYSGDGGLATSAQLSGPLSFALDASGNLYISDVFNHVIRKVTSGGTISTVAGNGSYGYSGDGGPATNAQLNTPQGVAVDASGNLYIADYSNYVIRKVTPGGIISTVAGNNTQGNSGDGGQAASAQLTNPLSLAVDISGNLYIGDIAVIRKVTQGIISTLAGNGTFGYSGDGGPGTNAQLADPYGIAADVAGNLYIADFENSVIRKVTPLGTITRVAGTGVLGFSGDGGPATSAQLFYPHGVTIDAAGNLYIADTSNQRIRKVGQAAMAAAATPIFSPAAGTYTSAQTVTISDSTPGATIYYTTDGSTPTTTSSVYSGSIAVATTETLKAIAVASGYASSAVATAAYTINVKAGQTISFNPMAPVTYGAGPIQLSATATSGLPVSFAASGPATISGSMLSVIGKGNVTVTATQPGSINFAPAPAVIQSFSVLAKSLTVTANSLSRSVGAANPTLTAAYSGFVNGETSAVLSGSPALSTTATTSSAAGLYPISVLQGTLAAANYTFAFIDGTLSVVAPPSVAITAASTLTKVSGGYQATVTVTNIGTANAADVKLTAAVLGPASGSPLPLSLGPLAAGGSTTVIVVFPASAGSSGSTVIEKFTGTYTGGTFTFSIRAKLP